MVCLPPQENYRCIDRSECSNVLDAKASKSVGKERFVSFSAKKKKAPDRDAKSAVKLIYPSFFIQGLSPKNKMIGVTHKNRRFERRDTI